MVPAMEIKGVVRFWRNTIANILIRSNPNDDNDKNWRMFFIKLGCPTT